MAKVKKIVPLLLLAGIVFALWLHLSPRSQDALILYGNVDQRQIELAFKDAERIEGVFVEEGMAVQPGQVLARLETRRLRDRIAVLEAQVASAKAALDRLKNGTRPEEIDQARAAVAVAEAELVFADTQYERFSKIWKQSSGAALSRQDLDEALQQLNVARAKLILEQRGLRLAVIGPRNEDLAEAEAVLLERRRSLEELRNRLEDAELKSPVHSVVNRRLMEPGDMASPQKAVFSLAVFSPKWVRAYVAEPDLGRIRPDMEVVIYTDSHPDEGVPGKVGFISSVAEFTPKTVETTDLRTSLVYEVRIYVDDSHNRLRLGMPATVIFPSTAEDDGRGELSPSNVGDGPSGSSSGSFSGGSSGSSFGSSSGSPLGTLSDSPSDSPSGGPFGNPSGNPSDSLTGGQSGDFSGSPLDSSSGSSSDSPSGSPLDSPSGSSSDSPYDSPPDNPSGSFSGSSSGEQVAGEKL